MWFSKLDENRNGIEKLVDDLMGGPALSVTFCLIFQGDLL
jgi:hypothetical protein